MVVALKFRSKTTTQKDEKQLKLFQIDQFGSLFKDVILLFFNYLIKLLTHFSKLTWSNAFFAFKRSIKRRNG